ncbi:hypothetical protein LCGC14_2754740, partial [marine sediment metagenome]
SLKVGYFVMEWLAERGISHIQFIEHLVKNQAGPIGREVKFFYDKADAMLSGQGRGEVVCSDIYWDVEEASFIRCMQDPDDFYDDMGEAVAEMVSHDVIDIINYQQSRIPTVEMYGGDVERWARETILWGRKSGTMLVPELIAAE